MMRRRAPEPPAVAEPAVPEWSPALAAARGAGLFDRKMPGWRKRLAGLPLRTGSVRECPLARLYGSYTAGVLALGLSRPEAVACGFIWPWGRHEDMELIAALDAAWAAQVTGGTA